MYKNLKQKAIAKRQFKMLIQKSSAIDYTVQFQIYAIQMK